MAKAKPLTESLRRLLDNVNATFAMSYNGILVNLYQNGLEYISAHSDDRRGLDEHCDVLGMNVGASRIFRIRDKRTKKIVLDMPTRDNQAWMMKGLFQDEFTHEVPVQRSILDARVSFTFRKHVV